MPNTTAAPPDVEDSASSSKIDSRSRNSSLKGTNFKKKGGKNLKPKTDKTPASNASSSSSEKTSSKSTPGFADGNSVLQSYGLSVSGRKERVLSAVKTDQYFQFVEQSWHALVATKPAIADRFSYAEFRHVSALQLYYRIEAVKFDALGIKPSAPLRIPLPRDLRVFQPIWSVLANIGTVDDDELRVQYIPDSVLPRTSDADSDEDVANLLSCTLYDWNTSWANVLSARQTRNTNRPRDAVDYQVTDNQQPSDPTALFTRIRELRKQISLAESVVYNHTGKLKVIGQYYYKYPPRDDHKPWAQCSVDEVDTSVTDAALKKTDRFFTAATLTGQLDDVMRDARTAKENKISVKFDVTLRPESYTLADTTIETDAGAYGAWLHWDPQLWLEYQQLVEMVSVVAMFSLSMPNDSTGTYMWLLPVESREKSESSVSARLPKASIPPVTWIMSLLMQMSTLPLYRRSTFYVETDSLSNVLGLRRKYIVAAIKDPLAVANFGTY